MRPQPIRWSGAPSFECAWQTPPGSENAYWSLGPVVSAPGSAAGSQDLVESRLHVRVGQVRVDEEGYRPTPDRVLRDDAAPRGGVAGQSQDGRPAGDAGAEPPDAESIGPLIGDGGHGSDRRGIVDRGRRPCRVRVARQIERA